MKRNLLLFLFAMSIFDVKSVEINTLISVHEVGLNNNGKPIKRTYDKKNITYRLINDKTSTIKTIHQWGKAKALNLEPGSYCFRSWRFSDSQWAKIINPICFVVKAKGIVNAGTWVIGVKASNQEWYAKIVDIKENYKEVETILKIGSSIPTVMHMPNKK